MPKKLKVLYVVNALLPNDKAHGIQIANTCSGVAGAGIDIDLCTPTYWGNNKDVFEYYNISKTFQHRHFLTLDVPGYSIGFYVRLLSFYVSLNFYLLYYFFSNLFQRRKLLVYVRAESVFALYFFSFICPVIFETHQIRNHEWLYKIILRRVKGIVVITNSLKNKFINEYHLPAKKILVARDAVDIAKFAKQEVDPSNILQKHNIPTDKKLVVYCGSLKKEKGVFTLADSAQKVSKEFHIVFIGGQGKDLEYFRKEYGHNNNISAIGQIDHKDVPQYIASAYVVVQPDLVSDTYASLYTSPMKLFEYMASGRTIVAADVPSLREVLTEESALFFKSGDSDSLAKVLNETLNSGQQLEVLAKQARKDVEQFTWEKRGELIAAHIRAIV